MLPEDQQIKYKYSFVRQNSGDKQIVRAIFEDSVKMPVEIWERLIVETSVNDRVYNAIAHNSFESESQILTTIRHDSILRVFDYCSKNGYHYLATEITGGANIQELFREKPEIFSVPNVLKWSEQLIAALSYLHTQSPPHVHGEIKPENIVLTPNGKIKLLPFGISSRAVETTPLRTQHFDVVDLHFSPLEQIWSSLDSVSQKTLLRNYDETSEQILFRPLDQQSDIFALGATLYYLFTHRAPIDALERSIDLLDGKKDPLPAPAALNPAIPAEISNLLVNALAIKRENRPASAATMLKIINGFSAKTVAVSSTPEIVARAVSSNEMKPTVQNPVFQNNFSQKPPINQISETKPEKQVSTIKGLPQEFQTPKFSDEISKIKDLELPTPPPIIKELLPEKPIEDQSALQISGSKYHSIEAETEISDESHRIERKNSISEIEPPFSLPTSEPSIFENAFTTQPKVGSRRAVFIALALMLVFGGSALAIWKIGILKPAVMQQTVSAEEKPQTISKQNDPAPSEAETSVNNDQTVSPVADKAESGAETFESASPKAETVRESGGSAQIYKNKTVSLPRNAKQNAAPANLPTEKKKSVTVDDLIGDN